MDKEKTKLGNKKHQEFQRDWLNFMLFLSGENNPIFQIHASLILSSFCQNDILLICYYFYFYLQRGLVGIIQKKKKKDEKANNSNIK